jgi:hypothetical protein
MHRVRCHFQEMPMGIYVTFMEGNRVVGRILRFTTQERLVEMLRRGRATLEDVNMVRLSLEQGRPGAVEIRLDDEQYASLKMRLSS